MTQVFFPVLNGVKACASSSNQGIDDFVFFLLASHQFDVQLVEKNTMSRTIKVKVVDRDGYGQSGYRVKAYGGQEVRTQRDGVAVVEADGSSVTIYVNGRTEYDGSVSRCPNPLIVERN